MHNFLKQIILEGVKFVLEINHFHFDNKFYLQIKEMTKGTKAVFWTKSKENLDKLHYFLNTIQLCLIQYNLQWRKSRGTPISTFASKGLVFHLQLMKSQHE